METAMSFRFLRGQGAQGCIRASGAGMLLSLQGLRAGEHTLYILGEGAFSPVRFAPGGDGSAALTVPYSGKAFIAEGQSVVLWEEEGGAEMNYWQAAEHLRRAAQPPPTETVSGSGQLPAPGEASPSPGEAPSVSEEDAHMPQKEAPSTPEAEAPPVFRAPADTEPVDALPSLRWPEEVRPLKPYFEARVPFAPFDAPGWRFVRLPSPLRNVPFCAVGVYVGGGAVTQVAYAVPGSPLRAPAALPGFRFQNGRGGQGYWTLWKSVCGP